MGYRRKTHSLTSAQAWRRYMPGGSTKRPFKESQVRRIPKGNPGGGRFMRIVNGGPPGGPPPKSAYGSLGHEDTLAYMRRVYGVSRFPARKA